MRNPYKSAIHSLTIVPTADVVRFSRYGSKVFCLQLSEARSINAVLGSISANDGRDGNICTKQIEFKITDLSEKTADRLERLKNQRVIALYTDASGRRRVCGSPAYPLTLDYTSDASVYDVSLSGSDTGPDGYLAG